MPPSSAKRLSSATPTFFYKRVFPVLWFGVLTVIFIAGLFKVLGGGGVSGLPLVAVPVLMAVVGFVFIKKMMLNLVDEVLDDGDALIVRNGGREERVALADIKNVNYIPFMSPPQVTLSLRRAGAFGDTIVFCGPLRLLPQMSNPLVDNLVNRIDAARERR